MEQETVTEKKETKLTDVEIVNENMALNVLVSFLKLEYMLIILLIYHQFFMLSNDCGDYYNKNVKF